MTDAILDDDATGRSALAKASWRLLPLIALGYGVAYVDRVNIGFAALQMNRDLHFGAEVYGLGGGLFFLSYALCEVPSNLALVRFGARRWIARIMLTWGVLAVAMMFVRTPVQFYALRFLLGAAEAGFFPGVVYYLTTWFPASHRGRAISRFYVALPLASVVMGLIAGPLLGLGGRLGLAGWQWLFLVQGLPAVLLGVGVLFLLPDGPADAPWLTPTERTWIADRHAADADRLGGPEDHSLLKALRIPVVLQIGIAQFCILAASYAFTLSAPGFLAQAAHLDPTQVGLLTAAGGVLGAVAMIGNGWSSDRAAERHLHLAVPLVIMATAFVVLATGPSPVVVMLAYAVTAACTSAVQAVIYTIPTDTLPRSATAVALAAIGSVSMVGAFAGPVLWGIARERTGGDHLGLMILPVPYLIATGIALALRRGARLRRALAPVTAS